MTEPDSPRPVDEDAPATRGAPAKSHGDPLLAASEGAVEGTEGTRHGAGATSPADE